MDNNTALVLIIVMIGLVFIWCFCNYWDNHKEEEYVKAGMVKTKVYTGENDEDSGEPIYRTIWVKAETVKPDSNDVGSVSQN